MAESKQAITAQTQQWLSDIVIGLNFCPFARKVMVEESIDIIVLESKKRKHLSAAFIDALHKLKSSPAISTSLLVLAKGAESFYDYLAILDEAQSLLEEEGFEGVFQLASFHPEYMFDGVDEADASHFTNRSPWPMIHIIREAEMAEVLAKYPKPERIPEDNIALCRSRGAAFFQNYLQQVYLTQN